MREQNVYNTIKSIIYDKATDFKKKHGKWKVLYTPKKQVVFMDTWNGYIYVAHMTTEPIVDDGFVDCQLNGRIHTVVVDPQNGRREIDVKGAIDTYKLLLGVL